MEELDTASGDPARVGSHRIRLNGDGGLDTSSNREHRRHNKAQAEDNQDTQSDR